MSDWVCGHHKEFPGSDGYCAHGKSAYLHCFECEVPLLARERDRLEGELAEARASHDETIALMRDYRRQLMDVSCWDVLRSVGEALANVGDWTAPDGSSMRHPQLIGKAVLAFLASRHPTPTGEATS